MSRRLSTYVHVAGRVWGPDDDVPDEIAATIGPHCWAPVEEASPAAARDASDPDAGPDVIEELVDDLDDELDSPADTEPDTEPDTEADSSADGQLPTERPEQAEPEQPAAAGRAARARRR